MSSIAFFDTTDTSGKKEIIVSDTIPTYWQNEVFWFKILRKRIIKSEDPMQSSKPMSISVNVSPYSPESENVLNTEGILETFDDIENKTLLIKYE